MATAYSVLADRYIQMFGSTDSCHVDDLALLAKLETATGPVVDVGCGPGHLTSYLASIGVEASGIDLVPEFIAHARANYPDCRFDIGSMLALPAADMSLAGILAWYSLIHFKPWELPVVLAEFHRALADDGVLILGFFDGEAVEPFAHKVTEAYFWPVEKMAQLVRECGFVVLETLARTEAGARPHAALVASKVYDIAF